MSLKIATCIWRVITDRLKVRYGFWVLCLLCSSCSWMLFSGLGARRAAAWRGFVALNKGWTIKFCCLVTLSDSLSSLSFRVKTCCTSPQISTRNNFQPFVYFLYTPVTYVTSCFHSILGSQELALILMFLSPGGTCLSTLNIVPAMLKHHQLDLIGKRPEHDWLVLSNPFRAPALGTSQGGGLHLAAAQRGLQRQRFQ